MDLGYKTLEGKRVNMKATVYSVKRLIAYWLNNRTFAIWAAAILTVLVRLGISFAFRTYQFDTANDHWAFGYEWGRIAKWLVETGMFSLDGFSPHTRTDPLYVFIIASFFYVFGPFTTAAAIGLIVLQCLLDGLSAWAIFALGERAYGSVEARVGSFLFALYPGAVFFAVGRIGVLNLTILLLCLVFLVTFKLADTLRLKWATLAGFLLGLLILTSSKPLSLIIIIPLWLLWVSKKQRLRMAFISLILVATTIAVMLPWSVRNSLVEGEPTISKNGIGRVLWVGNNSNATGYTTILPEPSHPVTDYEYFQKALSWIENNPADFAFLTLKRIIIFWSIIPSHSSIPYILNDLLFLMLAGLAMVGVLWPGEKSKRHWLLLGFLAAFPALFYVTYIPAQRHRYHVEPIMLIVASHGIRRLCEKFYSKPLLRLTSDPETLPHVVAKEL